MSSWTAKDFKPGDPVLVKYDLSPDTVGVVAGPGKFNDWVEVWQLVTFPERPDWEPTMCKVDARVEYIEPLERREPGPLENAGIL